MDTPDRTQPTSNELLMRPLEDLEARAHPGEQRSMVQQEADAAADRRVEDVQGGPLGVPPLVPGTVEGTPRSSQ